MVGLERASTLALLGASSFDYRSTMAFRWAERSAAIQQGTGNHHQRARMSLRATPAIVVSEASMALLSAEIICLDCCCCYPSCQ